MTEDHVTEVDVARQQAIVERPEGERRVVAPVQSGGGHDRNGRLGQRPGRQPSFRLDLGHRRNSAPQVFRLGLVQIVQSHHGAIVARTRSGD